MENLFKMFNFTIWKIDIFEFEELFNILSAQIISKKNEKINLSSQILFFQIEKIPEIRKFFNL